MVGKTHSNQFLIFTFCRDCALTSKEYNTFWGTMLHLNVSIKIENSEKKYGINQGTWL